MPSTTSLTLALPDVLHAALHERAARTGETPEAIALAALADALETEHPTLFQVSNTTALTEGVFDGAVSVLTLKEHGDFGLGTFDGLDGEMIVLDGVVYRADHTGAITTAPDSALAPFAVITEFPETPQFSLAQAASFADLTAQLDARRASDNLFYAVRITGHFARIKARSIARQPEGVTLVEAAAHQSEFTFTDVDATLVSFWTPAYARTINVAGWHLHALTAGHQHGGHVLDLAGADLQAQLAELADVRLTIPETPEFLEADLTEDVSDKLAAAESDH
ncbi:MAG: acetolactate decarboxylase [Thermomicrobiales bacterium]